MKYAKVEYFSTPNGPGCRTAIYFSGCQRAMEGDACKSCHNAVAWDKDYGKDWDSDIENEILEKSKPSYIKGFSILGGEPFSDFNLDGITSFAKKAKETYPEKDIWVWSGYTLDYIKNNKSLDIFNYVDYLVDGEFIQELKIPNLRFRGSTNQKIYKIEKAESGIIFEDITDSVSKVH